jgi:protein-tyrosine phosphatase
MIDIHTHILPGVDDGATNFLQAKEMVKASALMGVTDLFLTPHYMKNLNYLSHYEENLVIFDRLKTEIKEENLNINLYLGNEIYYDKTIFNNLENNRCVPLYGNYVLIEFDVEESDWLISEAIFNFKAKGYIPIIAHPERYINVKEIEDYRIMRKMGAKIQVNADGFTKESNKATNKFLFKLIKEGLIDFIASDVHTFRENRLLDAYNVLVKKFSKEKIDSIFNNRELFN